MDPAMPLQAQLNKKPTSGGRSTIAREVMSPYLRERYSAKSVLSPLWTTKKGNPLNPLDYFLPMRATE